jgi:hypothetical protein
VDDQTRVRVQSLDGKSSVISQESYDLLVGVTGYEDRSMFLPSLLAPHVRTVLTPAFDDHHVLSFDRNMRLAHAAGFDTREADEILFEALVTEAAVRAAEGAAPNWTVKVAIDASSMTRGRIARSLAALRSTLPSGSIIDVLYAPAAHTENLVEDGPVSDAGPLPYFAGWNGSPEIELGMIIGLGFESHLALGVVETHEPADIWAFVPHGVDEKYDQQCLNANSLLLGSVKTSRVLPYDVMQPYRCAEMIQAIVRATSVTHRMMLVPLGPKAFCVAGLAIALAYEDRLNAWRVSAGRQRTPIDRYALGPFTAIRLRIESKSVRVLPDGSVRSSGPDVWGAPTPYASVS